MNTGIVTEMHLNLVSSSDWEYRWIPPTGVQDSIFAMYDMYDIFETRYLYYNLEKMEN